MIEEKIIVGEGGEYPLNGMLTLPECADGPVAAVVMVHGSGPSNMDEKVMGCTPFKDLAAGLAERGVASVRYDKRTFAHGRKMVKAGVVTVKDETIEDALLATEMLIKDPRIDAGRIFILGHSMGAMLAPRIDAEGGNYRGLILMAGSPRKLEEIMLEQNDAVMKSTRGLVRWIVSKQVAKLEKSLGGLYEISDEEAKARKMGNGVTAYYFKEMGEHPAGGYIKALDKPVLVMQGSRDFQASVEKDFGLYKKLLEGKAVEFILYEGLNHTFVPAMYDDIMKAKQEYSKERHIGSQVFNDLACWISLVGKKEDETCC